ncbi:MAG: glucokinase [Deltaproteobacteria bacterium]|nr:glucokinase [Deltaproteobacteria bacterium]
MKILVSDIGGTNSRFAYFEMENIHDMTLHGSLSFKTTSRNIHSFTDLLTHFSSIKTPEFEELSNYDVGVFAIAGPVRGTRCSPPNIKWEIDVSRIGEIKCLLVNDFVAQAYGCLVPSISKTMVQIKEGAPLPSGTIAIVGAGTGLGHCALLPHDESAGQPKGFTPIPSEGGHAAFPFHGDDEFSFEQFLCDKMKILYGYGDIIISGRGLSLIHEFLTGEELEPKIIADNFESNAKTLQWFARFYGRACRNYALYVHASGGLIVSGGIAAKNPVIVESASFLQEFVNSLTQGDLLARIPIHLNRHEDIGLLGGAYYGLLSQMSTQKQIVHPKLGQSPL